MSGGPHPSHDLRSSDASTFDVICKKCGYHDHPGGWGKLVEPCPVAMPSETRADVAHSIMTLEDMATPGETRNLLMTHEDMREPGGVAFTNEVQSGDKTMTYDPAVHGPALAHPAMPEQGDDPPGATDPLHPDDEAFKDWSPAPGVKCRNTEHEADGTFRRVLTTPGGIEATLPNDIARQHLGYIAILLDQTGRASFDAGKRFAQAEIRKALGFEK